MSPLLEWGIPIIEWFQALGDGLLPIMKFFTFLGTENFYLLIMPSFLWCFDSALGFRVGLILLTSGMLNATLKLAFGFPRPYWVSDRVSAYSAETSFGAPSGHAQNAVTLWGRLAAGLGRKWTTVGAIVLILAISISRLYLGVHFPTDVLAGWIVGGIILILFLKFEAPVKDWLSRKNVSSQIFVVILFSLSLLALGLIVSAIVSGREVPLEWSDRAAAAFPTAEPISPTDVDAFVSSSAVLLGLGSGGVLLFSWGGFNAGGPYLKRLLRFLVGVSGVVIIYFGLRWIFPSEPSLLGHILRFIRYGLVGFWISYPAPRLFVKLNLA